MGNSDFCQLADPEVAVTSEDIQARRSIITAAMALQAKTDPANTRAESLDKQLSALVSRPYE
jgi:hypothetical protein